MGDRNNSYLIPQQQKLCLKVAFGMLNLYDSSKSLAQVYSRLLTEDEAIKKSDMSRSILVGSFIKPAIAARGDSSIQEGDPLLSFVIDTLFPSTLDVLSTSAPHILEMT